MRQAVRFVAIGEIVAPHGLQGEVRVVPLTDFPDRFARTARVWVDAPGGEPAGEPVKVEWSRRQGRVLVLKLTGVDSVAAAERLRGELLFVLREEAVPLPEGRFYRFELVGLQVVEENGRPVGELVQVLDNPANDLFVVRRPGGGPDVLVPAVKSVVREIDLPGGRLVVSLPPGLGEAERR
jgi:16S rRNA processing protein RimM